MPVPVPASTSRRSSPSMARGDPFGHRQLAGARLVAGEDRRGGPARTQNLGDCRGGGAHRRLAIRLCFAAGLLVDARDPEPAAAARRTRRPAGRPPLPGRPACETAGRRPRAPCGPRRPRAAPPPARPASSVILPLILRQARRPAATRRTTSRAARAAASRSPRRPAPAPAPADRAGPSSSASAPSVADAADRNTTWRRCGTTDRRGRPDTAPRRRRSRSRTSRTASVFPELSPLRHDRLARPAPEVRGAGRQRLRQRVAVGPRQHAHHPGARLLRDHRHQPVGVERDGGQQLVRRRRQRTLGLSRTGMPRARK